MTEVKSLRHRLIRKHPCTLTTCAANVLYTLDTVSVCGCQPACNEYQYDTSLSLSPWPSREYMSVLSMHPLNENNENGLNYSKVVATFMQYEFATKTDYIQKNLVELHIYLE